MSERTSKIDGEDVAYRVLKREAPLEASPAVNPI
jgi:hypothetical protein